ncbi:hypothetical protein U1Q18_000584 [Sarracenia purpurea var. burkii]
MGLITLEDLKGVKINPTDSVFECLVKIAEVAFELFNKEKSMEDNPDEKKMMMMMMTQSIDLDDPALSVQREKLVRQRSMIIREEIKKERSASIEELFKNPNNAGALDISKGERMMREKSLKKSVVYPIENLPKEERLMREKDLKSPVIEEKTKKNYRRPRSESDEEFEDRKGVWENKKKKRTSDCKVIENGPVPPPDLPPEFKNKIKESNGYEEKLLIQKMVTVSDVNIIQNRFTMPLKQVKDDFLRDKEKRHLDNSHCGKRVPEIKVKIIQPNCTQCDVTFKRWDMRKESGKISSSYVFNGEWKHIWKDNEIESGDVVQVWSFRKPPDDELCFVMVIVEKKPKNGSKCTTDFGK